MNSEQAPNPSSRITLSDQVDRHGMRRVRIDWRTTELDVETIVAAYDDLDAGLRASGAGRLEHDRAALRDRAREAAPVGGHHIGTARMAASPEKAVVDANCKVHHLANLHVAGAAVFPTSSHANPTLTLVALAIRLADRLKTIHGVAQ
ncbi:GMC family oxidoreductase [Rhizorhabdus argentea]|uniref:GMC family oxidoreductase n=1 Tax=Rhizorhabdus argentea TaxID=1387174 RepID=UPI0030EC9AEB